MFTRPSAAREGLCIAYPLTLSQDNPVFERQGIITDSQGRFRLERLGGGRYRLEFQARGAASLARDELEVALGEELSLGVLELTPE